LRIILQLAGQIKIVLDSAELSAQQITLFANALSKLCLKKGAFAPY